MCVCLILCILTGDHRRCNRLSLSISANLIQRDTRDSAVRGLALLGNSLFVLHSRQCNQLDELDVGDFSVRRQLSVPAGEWRHLSDMASCNRRRRLYISHNMSNCVHVLALALVSGSAWSWASWKMHGSPWGLSVTTDTGNLLVTMRYDARVDEYSPQGQRLRSVDLSGSGVLSLWHAVQLSSAPSAPEHLVVGHGDRQDTSVRVGVLDVVNGIGEGKMWYGGGPSSSGGDLLSRPQHLAIDSNGTLAVADVYNDRVLLFDDRLRRIGVVGGLEIDRATGWIVTRVCWIEQQLCVAEARVSDSKFKKSRLSLYELSSGRI